MNLGPRLRVGAVGAGVVLLLAGCTSGSADAPPTSPVASPTVSPSVIDPSSLVSSGGPTASVIASPSPTVAETSPSGAAGISAQEAADRAAVEATWARFWEVSDSLTSIDEESRRAAISTVAVDPTLSQALSDAASLDAKGREIYGKSVFHPYWQQSINGAEAAVMGDCTDTSASGAREKVSGEVKTVGVVDNNTRASFVRQPDGAWKVREIFYLVDIPCP